MKWSLSKIADICEGELHGEDRTVDHFVTDSRRIHLPKRTLFIAIRGERHDGHQFIENAWSSGVTSFIIDDKNYLSGNGSYVLVPNALLAFHALARAHRQSFEYPVIGITGSYGKTVVKDLLARKLQDHFHIVRSPRSYNSQTGVPLSIMNMSDVDDLGIFEAGISQPGEMIRLAEIISPEIGIFTTIGDAHDEGFKNREQKIEEKILLFSNSDVIIYPRDESHVHETIFKAYSQGEKLLASWGKSEEAFVHVVELQRGPQGFNLTYCTGGKSFELSVPDRTEYGIRNSLTLLTTLHVLGLEQNEIESLVTNHDDRQDHWEFIRTSYGKGLLVDIGPIDGFSIRTAKEQLDGLVDHSGISIILSGQGSSPLANDKRVKEIAEQSVNCDLIYIGPHYQELAHAIPSLQVFSSADEFIKNMDNVLSAEKAILLHGEWSPSFISLQSRLQEKSHQTSVTVNMASLVHNLNTFRDMQPDNTKVMAMVKAFAYGSGEAEVARLLQYHKVDYLAVAYPDEGVTLRNGGVELPIMVMNCSPAEYPHMIQYDLEPEIFSLPSLQSFIEFCQSNEIQEYPIHLKFDTGMHRLGFEFEDLEMVIDIVQAQKGLRVASVFSHLFASDGKDLSLSVEQIAIFKRIRESFLSSLEYEPLFHILNSSGITRLPEATFDMVRLGIGLYGHSGDVEMHKKLLPVLAWRTSISQIKDVEAGETVGYGGVFRVDSDRKIAVIPVGYADGMSRRLGNGVGHVSIDGHRCPFVGNICMDMSMVDITDVTCKEGDSVEIIGDRISIQEMAEAMGTIPYEVLTSIPPRIKRHYIFKG